jgi:hypothetical protein
MITFLLEDADRGELARVSNPRGESLTRIQNEELPLLSRLSEVDYDVFSSEELSELTNEIRRIRNSAVDPDEIVYLDEVLELCHRSQQTPGSVVVFTPWPDG